MIVRRMGDDPKTGSEAELSERIKELLALPGGYPVFKDALGKLGFDVKLRERNWPILPPWDVPSMQKRSFAPTTVIDVGAARGTKPLYEAFPDAFLALIEPLDEFADPLRDFLAERPGELLQTAVGEREGTKTMNVKRSCLFQSTLVDIPDSAREGDAVEPREVPVTTLDALQAQRRWAPPLGLKIDVEGFEYQVLEGAATLLGETQFVIAEVWPSPRSKNERGIVDIMTLLYASGFELCDILAAARPRVQREIMYLDMLFWRRPEAFARQLE
jgi:FkbM family methyltransferase